MILYISTLSTNNHSGSCRRYIHFWATEDVVPVSRQT